MGLLGKVGTYLGTAVVGATAVWLQESREWRKTATEMSVQMDRAADKLDPLALKTAFNRAFSLQEQVVALQRAIEESAQHPVIDEYVLGDGSRIVIWLSGAKGNITISSRLDGLPCGGKTYNINGFKDLVVDEDRIIASTDGLLCKGGRHSFRIKFELAEPAKRKDAPFSATDWAVNVCMTVSKVDPAHIDSALRQTRTFNLLRNEPSPYKTETDKDGGVWIEVPFYVKEASSDSVTTRPAEGMTSRKGS